MLEWLAHFCVVLGRGKVHTEHSKMAQQEDNLHANLSRISRYRLDNMFFKTLHRKLASKASVQLYIPGLPSKLTTSSFGSSL